MSKEMQVFKNEEFGKVRVIIKNGEPIFALKDLCRVLEVGNPSDVKKRLGDGVVSIEVIVDNLGRNQKVTFVNESGLYDVILDSRKPNARRFRKWIVEEVLPSIRKHGVYAIDNFIERSIADPDWAIAILTELKKTRAERDELKDTVNVQKTQIAELQPKSDYCDIVLKCSSLVSVSVIAKDYGYSAIAFNQLLYEFGIQYKQGDIWLPYQGYAELGWTKTKTYVYDEANNKCNTHMYWTQKGRLGLYQFLKEKGILPLIEQKE